MLPGPNDCNTKNDSLFHTTRVPESQGYITFTKKKINTIICKTKRKLFINMNITTYQNTHNLENQPHSATPVDHPNRSSISIIHRTALICQQTFSKFECLVFMYLGCAITPLFTYAHELGHSVTAHLLWYGVSTKIGLKSYGYSGGYTEIIFSPEKCLTMLGDELGESGAKTFFSAAGPLVELTLITAAFMSGSKRIAAITYACSTQLALYALSYWNTDCSEHKGHDFCSIESHGSTTKAITAIALCILGYGLLSYRIFTGYTSRRQEQQTDTIKSITQTLEKTLEE